MARNVPIFSLAFRATFVIKFIYNIFKIFDDKAVLISLVITYTFVL